MSAIGLCNVLLLLLLFAKWLRCARISSLFEMQAWKVVKTMAWITQMVVPVKNGLVECMDIDKEYISCWP